MIIGNDTIAILKCDCIDSFQDEKYGKQMRVHNVSQQKEKLNPEKAYCTVCGKIHSAKK